MLGYHTFDHLLGEYGYGLVFTVIGLEAMGCPLPGESMVIAASIYAATTGKLDIAGVIGAAVAGAIMGDNGGYLIGRWAGFRLLRRYGRRVGLTDQRLQLGRYLFQRQGSKVVFFGRFIAILRTFVALLAGANQMEWKQFLLWNAVGGVVWATGYGTAAYLLGDAIRKIEGPVAEVLAGLAVVAVVAGIILLRHNERRLEAKAGLAMRQDGSEDLS